LSVLACLSVVVGLLRANYHFVGDVVVGAFVGSITERTPPASATWTVTKRRNREAVMTLKTALLLSLAALTVWFIAVWLMLAAQGPACGNALAARSSRGRGFRVQASSTARPRQLRTDHGRVQFRGSVPDEQIPGTLNVGYALPTILQAFIYIAAIEVDALTLVLMIAAAVLGAWLGAGLVARWPRRRVQLGMGFALLLAAVLMLMQLREIGPASGEELALVGPRLWIGLQATSRSVP
jgi:hypothetical protein